MSKFLIKTTEVYRVDSEEEATQMLEEAKNDRRFTLAKYSSEYKEKISKGELVDRYYKIVLQKDFTDIKDPIVQTSIEYKNDAY